MPTIDELVKNYQQNQPTGPTPGNFGVPKEQPSINNQLDQMKNAGKLTKLERGIYNALPGVSTWMENNKLFGESVSDQLDKFNNSWAGKALLKLDILAEGLERTVGLASQMSQPDFDYKQLRAAWTAGSLTYDMSNLPTWMRDEDDNIVGMEIGNDLPGVRNLANARVEIQKYLDIGLSPKEALDRARDDYYSGLGALQLRAQLNDTWGHVLADPLNLLTGYLKPIQRLNTSRFNALQKLAGGVEGVTTDLANITKLAKTAKTTEDALGFTDDALRLAMLAGDTKQVRKLAEEASDLAKGLGKLDDARRYTDEASRFAKMSAEDAKKFSDEAMLLLGKKELTSTDRFVIMATGGDPFRPSEFGKRFAKIPILGKIAKQFKLTPQSQAKELMTLMSDNYRHTIGRMLDSANPEKEFADFVRRVGKGSVGVEYGHGMMTVQGRTVQSFSGGVDTAITKLFDDYNKVLPQRQTLDLLAETLEETPTTLLAKMADEPEAIMGILAKRAQDNPAIAQMLESGFLSADNLKSTAKILDGLPHNKEMFFAEALDAIETHAMQQAVVQFGVKEKGLATRWSDAIKQGESLAFLKLNPGYPIRNKVNNDLTMIARGVFGFETDDSVGKFWNEMGMKLGDDLLGPSRLGDAITPVGEKAVSKMSPAEQILEEALQGGNYGSPEKMKNFFANIDLGKFDMAGYWGRRIEERASRTATTIGTKQGLEIYMKDLNIVDLMGKDTMRALDEAGDEFGELLGSAIRASNGSEKKFNEILSGNLTTNVDKVLDSVEDVLGSDVRDVLGTEVLSHIKSGLPDAIKNNRVDKFGLEVRQTLERHVDDLFEKQVGNYVEKVKSEVVAGGPNVWNHKLMDTREMYYGARIEYAKRMPEAYKAAREAAASGDYTRARSLFEKEALDAKNYHNRLFKRMEATIDGMEQGAEELKRRGVNLPFKETKRTFKAYQENWDGFWRESRELKQKFWDDIDRLPRDQQPKWEDVQKQIDVMYKSAVRKEDEMMLQLDDAVAQMIPDTTQRNAYMKYRDQLAELNRIDKEEVSRIFDETIDLPGEERELAWNTFWQDRKGRFQQMREMDSLSIMAQQGDPNALARVADEVAEAGEFDIFKLANEYGIASASERAGVKNNQTILATVNKYIKETGGVTDVPGSKVEDIVTSPAKLKKQAIQQARGAGVSDELSKAAFDARRKKYPTKNIEISKSKNLPPEERVLESKFAQKIDDDLDGTVNEYWSARDELESNQLNVDLARELSEDYLANPATAGAIQKPSSALIKKMWKDKLAEPLTAGGGPTDRVVFTAGGGGSGKGTALRGVDLTDAHVVLDSTMSDVADLARIEEVLATGRKVDLFHVARDPLDAWQGALKRSVEEGRVLPLEVWAEAHAGAPDVFRKAIAKYKNNPNVNIQVIDNTGPFGSAKSVDFDFLEGRAFDKDELITEGRRLLEQEYKNGNITEEIYQRTLGTQGGGIEAVSGLPADRGAGAIESAVGRGAQGADAPAVSGQPELQQGFSRIEDIPEDVAREAFEARRQIKGTQRRQPDINPEYIADYKKVLPDNQPDMAMGMDEAIYGRMQGAIDEIVDSAKRAQSDTPVFLKDLPEDLQKQVSRGLDRTRNELASVRYKAQQYGQWRRDAALLNYNRRTNFDNQLQHIAPFIFWSTSSAWKWAVESIDRPAMLTNFLRAKKLLATGGVQREGIPSRVKGKIRLPFAPEWMGEQFIDPLRVALPFDNWASPFEQFQRDQQGMEGRISRLLEEQKDRGEITQEQYDEAMSERGGNAWDFAEQMVTQNEGNDRFDGFDFASTLMSPHAPLMWAYNAAMGDKEDIGPFAPLSRFTRNAMTAMGVKDWNNSKYNIEAKIRREMGLPSFDKWDNYRIKRMASSMAGEGLLTPDEAKEVIALEAMVEQGKITPEQAKEMSDAYDQAVTRTNKEFTGGTFSFLSSTLGFSITNVTEGEMIQRGLTDDFIRALETEEEANESLQKFLDANPDMEEQEAGELWAQQNPKLDQQANALMNFFEENPEYETRLGLFDSPEEQVHKFYVDAMWKKWMEMPKLHQDEAKEHLGTDFQQSFLNKETRSYDDIPVESMVIWMKMMNVDPLGGLTADQRVLVSLYGKVQFSDPELAQRLEVFYDNRKDRYPGYYTDQRGYFEKDTKQERNQFLQENPRLRQYWDFRRDFMNQNPDLVPYMTDNERDIEKAKRSARGGGAVWTAQEVAQIVQSMPPSVQYVIGDSLETGDGFPPELYQYFDIIAEERGMSSEQMLAILEAGQ
jgi:hypothetical protein